MKRKVHEGSRQQRRRPPLSLSARVGGAAAMLAAAWSLPHRCCHALRVSTAAVSGAGCQYRGYVGAAAQRASRTTASLSGGFVPGGAGRRRMNVGAAAVAGSPSFSSTRSTSTSSDSSAFSARNGLGRQQGQQGRRTRVGAMRMVSGGGSDEGKFFKDPDAPDEVDGVGPPGPLVGGDQVRPSTAVLLWLCACSLMRAAGHNRRGAVHSASSPAFWYHTHHSTAAVTAQQNWH